MRMLGSVIEGKMLVQNIVICRQLAALFAYHTYCLFSCERNFIIFSINI